MVQIRQHCTATLHCESLPRLDDISKLPEAQGSLADGSAIRPRFREKDWGIARCEAGAGSKSHPDHVLEHGDAYSGPVPWQRGFMAWIPGEDASPCKHVDILDKMMKHHCTSRIARLGSGLKLIA